MPKIIKKIISPLFVFLIFFTTLTCKRSPIEPNGFEMLWLNFEDASCTEAWFNLKLNNLPKPVRVDVFRDKYLAKSFTITATNDTLFYIENLLPKQNFEVYVKVKGSDGKEYTSTKINFETMDTTSHEFTWQIWEFGQHSSSTLYDVAIVDENNIWAVGEIYMLDSLGRPDPNAYNAVHWDGTKWELLRIPYQYNGQNYYTAIRAIYAFNQNDIWFGIASLIHWNGVVYKSINTSPFFPALINKMWGSSSEDFYIVGNNGNIAHWDGRKWTKIESGTELDIYDIWGSNIKYGEYEILYVAAEHFTGPRRKLFSIKNNSVQELSLSNISIGSLYGIWFKSGRKYFVVGNGIYTKPNINSPDNWKSLHNGLTPYYTYAIRGSDLNNIFIFGSFGESLHFNGYSWRTFRNTMGFYEAEFLKTDFKENIVIAVGYRNNRGFIALGKK